MGFLHEGHCSLINRSKKTADITIVSIFVNPTQFMPGEDLEKYPRDFERDKNILKKENVDYLFFPESSEIYLNDYQTFVEVDEISSRLEGKFRPNHFKGVSTIVAILFNCISPDYVFFGQKDAQQVFVIKQMVKDLKYNLEIIVCPIIREHEGLAMSSRNIYLTSKERVEALVLSSSLKLAAKMVKKGERMPDMICSEIINQINFVKSSKLDYVEIVEEKNFLVPHIMEKGKKYYVLIACRIGSTRLIDNAILKI